MFGTKDQNIIVSAYTKTNYFTKLASIYKIYSLQKCMEPLIFYFKGDPIVKVVCIHEYFHLLKNCQ